uniref:CSON007068 protein n=1 Tax=Culicoides sonorensis TaxID=179676 RepID=A0A336LZZ2_CULSO
MEFVFNGKNCRICLIKCDDEAIEMSVMSKDFQELTGFQVNEGDPRKICAKCVDNLLQLKQFIEVCKKTEEYLEKLRNEPVKEEEEDFYSEYVFVEDEPAACLQEKPKQKKKPAKDEVLEIDNKRYFQRRVFCEICCKEMSREYLKQHMTYVHASDPNIYKCDLCDKFFKIKGNLTRHVKTAHLGIKVHQLERERKKLKMVNCKICSIEIGLLSLKSHIKAAHPEESPPYQCDLCGRFFSLKASLRQHIKTTHLNLIEKHPCEYCGRIYQLKNSLMAHVKNDHTNIQTYQCNTCDKTFTAKYLLRRHCLTHIKDKNLQCPECGGMFQSKHYLEGHRRKVHRDKTLPCKFCGTLFKNRSNLRQHEVIHLPCAYQCPVCPKAFAIASTLRGHVKAVHPEFKMPPKGTSNNCRICLVECEATAMEMSLMSKDFQELTGFQVNESDPPQKICKGCAENLVRLKQFMNLCRITEEYLEKFRVQSPEPENFIPTESVFIKNESSIGSGQIELFETVSNETYEEQRVEGPVNEISNFDLQRIQQKAAKLNKVVCKVCHKIVRQDYLRKHTKYYHTPRQKYQCDICKRMVGLKGNLMKHMKITHLGIKIVQKKRERNYLRKNFDEARSDEKIYFEEPILNNGEHFVQKYDEDQYLKQHEVTYLPGPGVSTLRGHYSSQKSQNRSD